MKYTGVKCLHPLKSFKNGYCQYFPCGHCEVCLSNKSFVNESLCDFEQSSCACAYFVTLTYSDAYIPVAMVLHDGDNDFRCYDVTTRYRLIDGIDLLDRFDAGVPDDSSDRFLGSFTMPFYMFRDMARKVRLKTYPFAAYDKRNIWHLPYLSVIDHKNFLKRFRKLYDEKFNPEVPEVRYFCAGARIGIIYFSSRRKGRPRKSKAFYFRVGSLVVLVSTSLKVAPIVTLRRMLLALTLYPHFIAYTFRAPVYYTPSTLAERFWTVYNTKIEMMSRQSLLSLMKSALTCLAELNHIGFAGKWKFDGFQSVRDMLKNLSAYVAYHTCYMRERYEDFLK